MQLFATGAVSWVMDRALPEDVPIETRMVTRAIERAQNTVEAKNAEIRKDLLKYDEVYNEQRKAVYARRLQIIDGLDLRQYTEELFSSAISRVVADCCPSEFAEEWDLQRLLVEAARYYPTKFTAEELEQAESTQQIAESLLTEAYEYYEERERSFPDGAETARELERSIMLQIIDQRWRQHLVEMDYLREGIHLRGLAQTDPLNAWQKEGFEMFQALWGSIDDDYLQYVMHAQLIVEEGLDEAEQAARLQEADYSAASDPLEPAPQIALVQDAAAAAGQSRRTTPAGDEAPRRSGSQRRPATGPRQGAPAREPGRQAAAQRAAPGAAGSAAAASQDRQKMGRNEPCFCGSGRKYKLCHGAG
jgi:preprotein translocase subunit SecA